MTKTQKNILIGSALGLFLLVGSGMAYIWYNVYQNWDSLGERASIQEDRSGLYVTNGLGSDQIQEILVLEIGGNEYSLSVDADATERSVELPPVTSIVPYRIYGEAMMEGDTSLTVSGDGVLLPNDFLKKEMAKAKTMEAFFPTWEEAVRQLNPYHAGLVVEETDARFSPEEIAKAQERLDVKLPSYYLELAYEGRAWQVTIEGEESGKAFRLLAPSELMSAAEWVEKNVGNIDWKESRADIYRQLQKDVVFAVSGTEPWVIRYGDKPCEDGKRAMYTGRINYEDFLVEDSDPFTDYTYPGGYCDKAGDLTYWQGLMASALRDALPKEGFTFVTEDTELEVNRANESPEGELKGYLRGEWY